MTYTALKVTDAGVLLYDEHLQRLAPHGGRAAEAFAAFARDAKPGAYRVTLDEEERLRAEVRGESRLRDGMPVRYFRSPFADGASAFAKPPNPNRYDDVRLDGVATLLLSASGQEVLESCSAAVMGWEGVQLLCVPDERPRVWSTTEAYLRRRFGFVLQPLSLTADVPLVLVNAVKGVCLIQPEGRRPLPVEIAEQLRTAFEESARRP